LQFESAAPPAAFVYPAGQDKQDVGLPYEPTPVDADPLPPQGEQPVQPEPEHAMAVEMTVW
jgi:hypothetical protein